jgi:Cupin-like domain
MIDRTTASHEERAWLDRAATSQAVETVLKKGEVLFIPSHWFHYIIGLQKNAQCNVRSGVDLEGDEEFGSANDVSPEQCDPRRR